MSEGTAGSHFIKLDSPAWIVGYRCRHRHGDLAYHIPGDIRCQQYRKDYRYTHDNREPSTSVLLYGRGRLGGRGRLRPSTLEDTTSASLFAKFGVKSTLAQAGMRLPSYFPS